MAILAEISAIGDEMIAIRHAIHAHPELGFEEFSTSDLVAEKLLAWGYEVHRGLAGTGVVGQLRTGDGPRIGLRADMDALPILEETELSYASTHPGKMHACGHDGHTATLLAAAKVLAQTRRFSGTLNVIFQPAEEGLGGARKMVEQGLFELFPCDAIFAMHNMPGHPLGQLGFLSGPFMASSDTVSITLRGVGGHGAVPHKTIDPVIIAATLTLCLQSVVSRNIDPLDTAIVSVGAIHAGTAANIIPASAKLEVSVRSLKADTRDVLQARITSLAQNIARSYGGEAEVFYNRRYPVLVNDEKETELARAAALDWVGEQGLIADMRPLTGSEDFAFMLDKCPGSYLIIGNGDDEQSVMCHHPRFDFNDQCLLVGASYWVKLVEKMLHRTSSHS